MDRKKRYQLTHEKQEAFRVVGIVTDDTDYRLSWFLNNHLRFQLVRTDDLTINLKKHSNYQHFSRFEDSSDPSKRIILLSNQSSEGIWLTIHKQIDFILILDDIEESIIRNILQKIQSINSIRGAFELSKDDLNHIEL
jgi:hypothetical protein